MKRSRRGLNLAVGELEPRLLRAGAGPTGTWLGQDGHDLVGPSSTPGPDGVQDIHILLSNLPAGRQVVKADILPYGGGEWIYNGPYGPWAAALVRAPGSTTADLYLDPYQVETGRTFQIDLTYDDGSTAEFWMSGGTASPSVRMPAAAVAATWLGQDGHDLTGPGPDVGPDGIQDAHITLSHLAPNTAIASATLTSPSGTTWEFGLNPGLNLNAELVMNPADPSQADFYFSPTSDLNGQTLTLTLHYGNGTTDSTTLLAGATDPTLRMPAPAPVSLSWNAFAVAWLGQDGQNLTGPGAVHLALSGLPAGRSVVSATLSDEDQLSWYYSANGAPDALDPSAQPMAFRAGSGPTRADIDFPPARDESNATLNLRLVLDDGSTLVTRFAGGACDVGLLAPGPAPTSVNAAPGADLNALANQYGTVHLAAGQYLLTQPLVLNHPVTITADPGTTLLFSQPATAPTWTAAIKVMSGHTTLEGFAVRFAGPVRWTDSISYGPAVIGTPDNFDSPPTYPIVGLTFDHLDLQSPPASSSWEAAPDLFRLVSARSGVIENNTLKGGTTEFFGGPWQFVGNTDLGTVPSTYTFSVVSGHYTHDLTISNNTVEPTGPSGKTWRFLVLTQGGVGDVVANNTVVGVGPMDNDTVPSANAPEVILTESYRLHFEGTISAVSPDGWVVTIPTPQGGPARTGDVLALLSGPQAGQWRMIAQALSPTTYLLDAPITPGSFAVSITQAGFVNETFQGNTVDSRGSSTAGDLVLAGNHFGTQVIDNHLLGGGIGLSVSAYPTEQPDIWGWSHAPVLGVTVAGNTFEDALQGAVLGVVHNAAVKTDQGRVYFSGTLANNTVVWSSGFLAKLAQGGQAAPLALAVGELLSADPAELLLAAQGNQIQAPPNVNPGKTMEVYSAVVNGQPTVNQGVVLPTNPPAPPTGLRLVNDTGASASDGITGDARLRFDADPATAGYEYSLTGAAGTYQPVATPAAFLPAGLVRGFNTVFVRAFDASGNRGPAEAIAFVDDPSGASGTAPAATNTQLYQYRIGNSGTWVPLGAATSVDPALLSGGSIPTQVRTVSQGGTSGTSSPVLTAQPVTPAGSAPPVSPTTTSAPLVSLKTTNLVINNANPAGSLGPTAARVEPRTPPAHRPPPRRPIPTPAPRAVHLVTPAGIHSLIDPMRPSVHTGAAARATSHGPHRGPSRPVPAFRLSARSRPSG